MLEPQRNPTIHSHRMYLYSHAPPSGPMWLRLHVSHTASCEGHPITGLWFGHRIQNDHHQMYCTLCHTMARSYGVTSTVSYHPSIHPSLTETPLRRVLPWQTFPIFFQHFPSLFPGQRQVTDVSGTSRLWKRVSATSLAKALSGSPRVKVKN